MSAVLVLVAATLGLLAFFEPCTIATHTLFAARSSQLAATQRYKALAQLLLSRSVLLAGLFTVAATVGVDALSPTHASAILGVIGAVYVVTRRFYLPVPHLEFFRLIPEGTHLSDGLKLGLTLPACTLPLVAVVGAIAAVGQRADIAALAGLVFSAMFSLVTIWDSMRGLRQPHLVFLGKAATASPYVTALALWGGAAAVWSQGV